MHFDRVEVFTATKARDRAALGGAVTAFLRSFKGRIIDKVVTQSSDNEFHCVTITLFLRNPDPDHDGGRVRRRDS